MTIDAPPALLPANASQMERALARLFAGMVRPPVPIRQLWNPWTCPVRLLPYLALALSVDFWREDWPEATKRRACAESFVIHRQKGTAGAIIRALAVLGLTARVEQRLGSAAIPQPKCWDDGGAWGDGGVWDGTVVAPDRGWALFGVAIDASTAPNPPPDLSDVYRLIDINRRAICQMAWLRWELAGAAVGRRGDSKPWLDVDMPARARFGDFRRWDDGGAWGDVAPRRWDDGGAWDEGGVWGQSLYVGDGGVWEAERDQSWLLVDAAGDAAGLRPRRWDDGGAWDEGGVWDGAALAAHRCDFIDMAGSGFDDGTAFNDGTRFAG